MGYKDYEKQKAYIIEWQRNHIKLGLCRSCSKPTEYRSRYCSQHFLSNNRRAKLYRESHKEEIALLKLQLRQRYEEEGRCKGCGNPTMESGRKYCYNCYLVGQGGRY